MKEACDTIAAHVQEKFSESDHLIAAKLVDSSFSPQYVHSFLIAALQCATKLWPVGNQEKLKTDLSTSIMSWTLERQHFIY